MTLEYEDIKKKMGIQRRERFFFFTIFIIILCSGQTLLFKNKNRIADTSRTWLQIMNQDLPAFYFIVIAIVIIIIILELIEEF